MVLVDTNIWIDQLRYGDPHLVELLEEDLAACHPWVRGELALGSLKDRGDFLDLLQYLPQVDVEPEARVMEFIDQNRLFARGIGWVDAQLLAACAAWPCRLWTRDKRLAGIAQELGLGWMPREKKAFSGKVSP